MTESMIERVARALHGAAKQRVVDRIRAGEVSASMSGIEYFNEWADEPEHVRCRLLYDGRAAIEAMREPTDAMVDAMNEHAGSIAPEYAWSDAIDAALNEQVSG